MVIKLASIVDFLGKIQIATESPLYANSRIYDLLIKLICSHCHLKMDTTHISTESKFSAKGFVKDMNLDQQSESSSYRLYDSRWGVFMTVLLFNISNNCLWICFGSVSTTAAEFYEVEVNDIDLLASIFLYVGIPMCFALTFIIDRFGLR